MSAAYEFPCRLRIESDRCAVTIGTDDETQAETIARGVLVANPSAAAFIDNALTGETRQVRCIVTVRPAEPGAERRPEGGAR